MQAHRRAPRVYSHMKTMDKSQATGIEPATSAGQKAMSAQTAQSAGQKAAPTPTQSAQSANSGQNKFAGSAPAKKGPRKLPVPVIALFLVIVAAAGYFIFQFCNRPDPSKLRVSGRIEGYETNIGAKVAGRVDFIAVREGDLVHTGDLIVRLADDDIQAQLRGARARLQKASETRDQAAQQIDVIDETVREAQLNKQQAIEDADGRIEQAQANVAASKANLAQAQAQEAESQADLKLARVRRQRYERMAAQGAATQDDADQAATNETTASATVEARRSAVDSARKQLIASLGALTQARTNRLNPGIREAQLISAHRQLIQAKSQLQGANNDIANAKADIDQIKANIAYLNIRSPIDAVVTARPVEPGAVVAAGQTVLSIINLNTVYLRAYVPDGEIGKVRVGQKADIYLDSNPKEPYAGHMIEIDPEASFTPENIYFKDDRVKQVFGTKIAINNPQGYCKPGMPADADILINDAK